MIRDVLEIDNDSIPYSFDMDIEDQTYTLTINYNTISREYSVDLFTEEGTPIYLNYKLVLNQPLWFGIEDPRLPAWQLVPYDESGHEKTIDELNFNKTIFISIDDLEEGDS